MLKRKQLSPIAAAALLLAPQAQALTGVDLTLSGQQFATESAPSSRVDFKAGIRTQSTLRYLGVDSEIPTRQADFYLLYESGSQGERGLDIDSVAQRWGFDVGHLWLGRIHPANEGRTDSSPRSTSAIGASWAQNQGNALEPRVSGWVGAGLHFKTASGVYATLAYSPLFLPSFGARLDFSESGPAQGSRFARLPPQSVQISGANPLPLYYRIDTGDLMKIVRQDQAWFSIGREFDGLRAEAMAWSAPSPNPSVSTAALLQANATSANVLVTVQPSFVRETFLGGALESSKSAIAARLEALNEAASGRWIVSARISPLKSLELGYLNTFDRASAAAANSPVSAPLYAKDLYWMTLSSPDGWKLRPSLRVEQQPSQGGWVRPRLDWLADSRVHLFANASLITGAEGTYFGNWRSLDSISMGARILW